MLWIPASRSHLDPLLEGPWSKLASHHTLAILPGLLRVAPRGFEFTCLMRKISKQLGLEPDIMSESSGLKSILSSETLPNDKIKLMPGQSDGSFSGKEPRHLVLQHEAADDLVQPPV